MEDVSGLTNALLLIPLVTDNQLRAVMLLLFTFLAIMQEGSETEQMGTMLLFLVLSVLAGNWTAT